MSDADCIDERNEGEQMHAAIREWAITGNDDRGLIVTRFVVVVECNDDEGRWVQQGAYTADGASMMPWEALGLLKYASGVAERDTFYGESVHADEDTDD